MLRGNKGVIYRKLIVNKLTKLKNALTKKAFASWSQEEFLASIEEINRLASELSSTQSQLLFCIVPGSYRTSPENEPLVSISRETSQETEVQIPGKNLSWHENWRSTLRISAFKVNKATSVIESEKVIDLNTYGKTLNLMIQFGNHQAQLVKSSQDEANDAPTGARYDLQESSDSGNNGDESDQDSDNFVLVCPVSTPEKLVESQSHTLKLANQPHCEPSCSYSSNTPSTSFFLNDYQELSEAETSFRNWSHERDQMSATIWFSNLSSADTHPGDLGINGCQELTSRFEDGDFDLDLGIASASLCSICMDKKANMILPCTHMYCSECIEEWEGSDNENHDRCPHCRNRMSSKDNWFLPDKPSQLDLNEYLVSLISK